MATTRASEQVAPLATTVTDVYTAPASKLCTVRVAVTNTGAAAITYRVSFAPLGAADAPGQYFIYDETLDANSSGKSFPMVLMATDVIRAYTDIATLNVMVNGIEQDV